MPFYERKIISGDLVEIEQFFSHGKRIPRGARLETTSLTQAEQNEKQRKKEFIRLLNQCQQVKKKINNLTFD